jgi:imidazolonepropionase-like amidohydrolase
MKHEIHNFNRRDFLKMSAAAAAAAALPDLALTGCASVPSRILPAIDYTIPLQLTNCNVVDVVGGQTFPGRTITIVKGKIQTIGPNKPDQNSRYTTINVKGSYVIPGLIDAHCHLTLQSCGFFKTSDAMKYVRQININGMMQVDAGVTTVRDMGSFPKMIHNLVDDYEKGSLVGPRVVYCNAFINIDGGHPDIKPTDLSVFAPITTGLMGDINSYYRDRKELMAKLHQNVENGAFFIKLTMDDRSLICGKGKLPVYSDDDLKAIFDFAEKKNLPVAVHSIMYYGFKRALQYPVHSMEHITSDEYINDADIRTMVRKKIAIVPTLLVGQNESFRERFEVMPGAFKTPFIENELKIKYDYLFNGDHRAYDPDLHKLNLETINWFKNPGCSAMPKEKKFLTDPEIAFNYLVHGPANIRKMRDAGVLIGCGTDSGVPFHYHGTLWREMEMMSRIGFRNDVILRFATINNAVIIGAGDSIGSLQEGKFADMVVLKENPLQKIEACRSPQLVMIGGTVKSSAVALQKDAGSGGKNSYTI